VRVKPRFVKWKFEYSVSLPGRGFNGGRAGAEAVCCFSRFTIMGIFFFQLDLCVSVLSIHSKFESVRVYSENSLNLSI